MASGSLAWADYDNDSQLDFLVTGSNLTQLWRNTGNGFERVTVPGLPGVGEGAVAWGDYNNDGRLDFLLTGMNQNGNPISQVWRNTGSGFVQTAVAGLPGVWLGDVAWADFDRDGRLDFLITGTRSFSNGPRVTQLWRNTGDGFVRVTIPGLPGLESSSIAWGDYDNDGWIDFLLMGTTNGMFASSGPSPGQAALTQLWRNTGAGFEKVEIPGLPNLYSGRVAWGDFDNDNRLDFLITGESSSGKKSQLWKNNGDGFTELPIPNFPGNFGGTLGWADYDNDGRLDFLVSGGEGEAATQLWRNTGGSFVLDPTAGLSQIGVPSLAWADYDRDGRIDFLITGFNGSLEPADQYFAELWRNIGSPTNLPPTAPTGLRATVLDGVTSLQWDASSDASTPPGALTYNVRLGTQPGALDIVSPHADPQTGFRRVASPGNAGTRTQFEIQLPPGTYYASVQAVDSAWTGSAFSTELVVSTLPRLTLERQGNTVIVQWSGADPTSVLESSETLSPDSWIAEPTGTTSPATLPLSDRPRFFRLRKP